MQVSPGGQMVNQPNVLKQSQKLENVSTYHSYHYALMQVQTEQRHDYPQKHSEQNCIDDRELELRSTVEGRVAQRTLTEICASGSAYVI